MEGTSEIKSIYWIGTAVMLCFAFGLLFLVYFYQNYFSKMKQKEAELLLEVSKESEHNERKRIAADLHDGVSGDLNAVRNFLTLLHKNETDFEKQELFVEIKKGVESAIESTRLLSYKLMPPMLESFGFVVTLADYFERLTKTTGITFLVNCNDASITFPITVRYELFRVVQEFTTNMLKYGSVKNCSVVIYVIANHVYIEIIDDGIAFDFKSKLATSTGTGLKNINSRLKIIVAELLQREVMVGNHFVISLKK